MAPASTRKSTPPPAPAAPLCSSGSACVVKLPVPSRTNRRRGNWRPSVIGGLKSLLRISRLLRCNRCVEARVLAAASLPCGRICRYTYRRRAMKSIAIFIARFIVLGAAAFAVGAQTQNISIATGGTGGVYYPLGGGMAAVLSKYVDGMQATAEVTGGSVANLQLISTGKPYLALSMTDAALDALKGEDKFKGKPVPVRKLMILYPNRMHVVIIEGTCI